MSQFAGKQALAAELFFALKNQITACIVHLVGSQIVTLIING